MDWILIVIILLCLASLVLNIIQVSRNNSENFDNSNEMMAAELANEEKKKIAARDVNVRMGNARAEAYGKTKMNVTNVRDGNADLYAKTAKKEPFADVKNGSYLNFFDSEVPFQPGQSWMNLQQCYLNY